MLAEKFPRLRFRSGNAPGSDEAFSNGIAAVDPTRLEIVAPYVSHREKFHYERASYHSPESLDVLDLLHLFSLTFGWTDTSPWMASHTNKLVSDSSHQ